MELESNCNQDKNPREDAGFFSKIFFLWVIPLMRNGQHKDLELDGLPEALREDKSYILCDSLEKQWTKELNKKGSSDKDSSKSYEPSLLKALIKTFGIKLLSFGFFVFIEECILRLMQPLAISRVISYFARSEDSISKRDLYLWSGTLILSSVIYVLTHHPYFFGVMRLGMQMRVACSAILYRKALRLSKGALSNSSVGQMVNLLSNDVNRFEISALFLHYIWAGPLQFIIVAIITWHMVGPFTFVGGILMIAFVPLQGWLGRVFSRLRCRTAGQTDIRIRIMNEIIDGIKVIKMYAWEYSFVKLVNDARKNEINTIKKMAHYESFKLGFFLTASRLVMCVTLFMMVILGEEITSQKVFLVFGLYNVVRLSLVLFFPNCVSFLSAALVSVKRIEKFLLLEEVLQVGSNVNHIITPALEESLGVEMSNVSGIWLKEESEDDIKNVSLKVGSGELCAIIGPVGSGKSSILQALLKEFPIHTGRIDIKGKLSYASQESWIFNGTVKQNILMGKPFIEKRYYEVLRVCALEHDIQEWSEGDFTFVGEKGVSLSGGQKARINLARCVYEKADIYILDDPLSAVDAHVGRHLFDKCIKKFLSEKIVILVTHQLQYLYDADNIVLLSPKGEVEDQGTYSKLMTSGKNFSSFLEPEPPEEEDAIDIDSHPKPSKKNNIPEYLRSRLSSISSMTSLQHIEGCIETEPIGLSEEESRMERLAQKRADLKETKVKGFISWRLYADYFLAGSSWLKLILVYGLCVLTQILFTLCDWWIQVWTNAADARNSSNLESTNDLFFSSFVNSTDIEIFESFQLDTFNTIYFFIYFGLIFLLIISSQLSVRNFIISCLNSSKNLHNLMFERVIFAKSSFFDNNPVGRILNRFSKDLGSIDDILPMAISDTSLIFFNAMGIFFIVILTKPEVLLPMSVLFFILLLWRRYYLSASTSIKRLEGIARSPIFSQLSASLNGLTTIRAIKIEDKLIQEFDNIQDVHTSSYFSFLAITRCFGFYVDWIVVLYISCIIFLFVFNNNDLKGGDVGVNLTLSMLLAGMIQWGLRQSAEVENLMTSVERISEYKDLPRESNLDSDIKLESSWPDRGVIQFVNVSLRYEQNSPPILKNLNFESKSFEKIGIIGRTGAGKSSMISALFRLVEPEGDIIIDGQNICQLGLHDIRKKISIIPQDPILFCGSVRKNLDPFDEYEDTDIWHALEQAKLSTVVSELKAGLDSEVLDRGSNFSIGQRQLICLARAILRKNKILVMDEATANVDPHTDFLIQEAIRTKFSECTVFTIAHRLHTVMDSDRIIVLKDGKIEEFGKPYELLRNKGNLLSQMVHQTGTAMAEKLEAIAKSHYKEKEASHTNDN